MKRVNVIRHLAFEDLGSFADVCAQRGLAIDYLEAGIDDLTQLNAASDDPLVILGGPISVNDSGDFPFLETEIELLQQRIARDKPTLGICLGAQLIAKAMGSQIYPGKQKEIGWAPVQLTAAGQSSPLSGIEQNASMVLHWHGETFDLPEAAELLASTDIAVNQAFSVARNTIGLQFHIEVSRSGLERWFIGHIGEIEQVAGVSVAQLRADTARYADAGEQAGRDFFSAWLDSISL